MSTSLSPRSSAAVHPTRQQLDELDALLQRMLELPVNGAAEEPAAEKSEPAPEADSARPAPGVDADADDKEAWVPLRSSWQPSAQTWGPLAKQWQEAQQAGQALPQPAAKKSNPPPPTEEESGPRIEVISASKILALSTGQKATSVRDIGPLTSAVEGEEPRSKAAAPTAWRVDAAANEPLEPLPSLKKLLAPLAPAFSAEKKLEPAAAPTRYEPPLSPWQWPFALIDSVFDGCLLLLGPLSRPLRSRGGKTFLGVVGLLCLTGAAAVTALDWFGWTW